MAAKDNVRLLYWRRSSPRPECDSPDRNQRAERDPEGDPRDLATRGQPRASCSLRKVSSSRIAAKSVRALDGLQEGEIALASDLSMSHV
jgi:hypothetical protein